MHSNVRSEASCGIDSTNYIPVDTSSNKTCSQGLKPEKRYNVPFFNATFNRRRHEKMDINKAIAHCHTF